MCQNEAYILASEIGGWSYNAGPNNWRVIKRLNKYQIRVYMTRNTWEDKDYMGGGYGS
jgi:hypothetical protein